MSLSSLRSLASLPSLSLMSTTHARRLRLLEELRSAPHGRDLAEVAALLGADERTIRRDVEALRDLLEAVGGIEIRRGRVFASSGPSAYGYFGGQVELQRSAKEAIAAAVVADLADNLALAITAGSTTYYAAREIRRSVTLDQRPSGLIVFTNSLPVLVEMEQAGISTGVLGEVYNAEDRAFHSHNAVGAFHASLALVGASGVVANPNTGELELYSHRAEEAVFLEQLLAPIPEIWVAVDGSKLGRRHPWAFTNGRMLAGKRVRLITDSADPDLLDRLRSGARSFGYEFDVVEVAAAAD